MPKRLGVKQRHCQDCGGSPIVVQMDDGRLGYWCEFCEEIMEAEPTRGRIVKRYRNLSELLSVEE